jgi:hypothetical protein
MKVTLEVKGEDKVTTYTADLSPVEDSVRKVADKVSSLLKETFGDVFKKETYTREK